MPYDTAAGQQAIDRAVGTITNPWNQQAEIMKAIYLKKVEDEINFNNKVKESQYKSQNPEIDPWQQFQARAFMQQNPGMDFSGIPGFEEIQKQIQAKQALQMPPMITQQGGNKKSAMTDRFLNSGKEKGKSEKSDQQAAQPQMTAPLQPQAPKVVMGKDGFQFKEPVNLDSLMLEAAKLGVSVDPSMTQQDLLKQISKAKSQDTYIAELPQLEPTSSPEERQAFLEQLAPQDRALVKGITEYNLDIGKVTSLRGGARERIAALAARYDPSFNMMQYESRKAFMKKYTSGTLQDNRTSINTAIKHIGTMAEKLHKLKNLNQPFINAVINPIEYQMGKKEMAGVKASILAVSNELAKAFKGTGVSAEQEIDEFRKAVSSNASPEQQEEFVNTFIELLDGRITSVYDEYVNAMGKEPEQVLEPAAVGVLAKINEMYSQDRGEEPQVNNEIPEYDPATEKLQRNKKTGEYRVVPK